MKRMSSIFRKYTHTHAFRAHLFYLCTEQIILNIPQLYFHSCVEADNNGTCSGKAVQIKLENSNLYFMRDNNDTLYWTKLDYNELDIDNTYWQLFENETLERKNEFIKKVRIGKYPHTHTH